MDNWVSNSVWRDGPIEESCWDQQDWTCWEDKDCRYAGWSPKGANREVYAVYQRKDSNGEYESVALHVCTDGVFKDSEEMESLINCLAEARAVAAHWREEV